VIAFPGRKGPQSRAGFLARHGYGVLLFDRRGEGASDGEPHTYGWGGDRDVKAAIAFLQDRPEVDPDRIGGIGLSVAEDVRGLAFLVAGKMSVAASGQGGLMVRVDPADSAALLDRPHAHRFEMRGRALQGWLRVDGEGVRTRRQLEPWVKRGVAYARSLSAER